MLYNKRVIKTTARVLLISMGYQLIAPLSTFALTTGPSQPEVQSFEPVGTTDMVDLFTGDFVYNIPLLDIEGYPINISYHSGGDMEQEASWVGLGWNINPGSVNRSVRGMPDDFAGEKISKTINIKPERNVRVGLSAGVELAGMGYPYFNLGLNGSANLNVSNYRGVSVDFGIGIDASVNVIARASAGINLGVGSQSGADIDYNLGLNFSTSQIINTDLAASLGLNFSTGYNTRSGLKARTLSIGTGVSIAGRPINGPSTSISVPVGVQNYLPVITNASRMSTLRGQIKLGGEVFGGFPNFAVNGMVSNLTYEKNGTRSGFGYLYSHRATDNDIQDFTRDKDGMFNETMKFAAPGNMTYDIYNVSGQGTGGSFRPFRNDFGSVYDPVVTSRAGSFSVEAEAGIGNLLEGGANFTTSSTETKSGPWEQYKRPFKGREAGNLYEDVYFKKAGEITAVDPAYFNAIGGFNAVSGSQANSLPESKPSSKRDPRGSLVYYFTAEEASQKGVATSRKIYSYTSTNGFAGGPVAPRDSFVRDPGGKGHYISEVMQVQTDGRRYVYGIPAMNKSQTEMSFAVAAASSADGLVSFASGDNTEGNTKGRDNFYSATQTPAFAHSYLLTSVLSTDYVDVSGDGLSDDDFGTYTKFNYTKKNGAYNWKTPYGENKAQYNPGFKSDKRDDKASYVSGSREQWMLHSVESKNYVAEFYTSVRTDAKGVDTAVDHSYKLDSIKLYNKHDRFINMTAAVPIKTVIFNYDYSLCKGIPNSTGAIGANGKLTLRKIYVRYGNSQKSMISPYEFDYGYNPNYSAAGKDRWGAYKPNNAGLPNTEFPFVNQSDTSYNTYASAWSLEKIKLPSGGTIQVQYEMDDYAFVQDKVAMEMFMLKGMGGSKNFSAGSQLYIDKNSPNLYYYFQRRKNAEKPELSFKDNYFKGQDILYYSIETRLADGAAFEPVKGYAEVQEVGYCNDDPNSDYGYVKVKPIEPEGGGASVNPTTYMGINFGRYYLSHIIFPGADDDLSGIQNVLSGLKYAFGELLSLAKNPIKRMVEEGKAKNTNLALSYIRLNSPGLMKKGGGQRVKQLTFYDNWNTLAGGNAQAATYGKKYDYTTEDVGSYGKISSGVASYEPQIGGDENPMRLPSSYTAQSGGKFPPHDPIGLYQEMPIGETLYPSPVVGYSKVTVSSIHQEKGRSSQGVDISEFYTARDFPLQVTFTPMETLADEKEYSLFDQKTDYRVAQGFSFVFNDMHGKPKKTEHRVLKPGSDVYEMISYQQYKYFADGNKLNNMIPVIEHDNGAKKMRKVDKRVGVEADVTIDSREKVEKTESSTTYVSFNLFIVGIIPIPLPMWYPFGNDYENNFGSVVTTKVIQQYGILKEVQSFQEGALTIVRNEAFDPLTGQAVVTSVNNEFNDTEYSVNYPAYWGYQSMGPAYTNTGYTEFFESLSVSDYTAQIPNSSMNKYNIGDELYITYNDGGPKDNNVWVTGVYVPDSLSLWNGTGPNRYCTNCIPAGGTTEHYMPGDTVDINRDTIRLYSYCTQEPRPEWESCGNLTFFIKPRYKYTFPASGTITNVRVKVVRSGNKNQLTESIQSYTSMASPFDASGLLKDNNDSLISVTAREYSDTLTAILPRYNKQLNPTFWDSLNVYANGTRQIKRLHKEYAYIKNRNYSGTTSRRAGLFAGDMFWKAGPYTDECSIAYKYCNLGATSPGKVYRFPSVAPPVFVADFKYLIPNTITDPNWVVSRTVTKYSPWGQEIENKDAIGNYTAAVYGYNQALPVALAQNARQHEVFAESFEDYQLLSVSSSLVGINLTPFSPLFGMVVIAASPYSKYNLTGTGYTITNAFAHSGVYTVSTGATANLSLKVATDPLSTTTAQVKYLPFTLQNGKKYIVSYWMRPKTLPLNPGAYTVPSGVQVKSNIIDTWQQVEGIITVPATGTTLNLTLPPNAYVDDIRIFPQDANIKSFVYHPVSQKLVATLDENNFASFYEYDQEGNLVRTKKETEKGIATITESRSANPRK